MTQVSPGKWPLIAGLYLCCGLVIGLADPAMRSLAATVGLDAGWGTFAVSKILMPAAMIALALAYPRVWSACVGGALATWAMNAGMTFTVYPDLSQWIRPGLLIPSYPTMTVALIGYAALGGVIAHLVQPWRHVGPGGDTNRCHVCGYLLTGLRHPRCPECGAMFDPARLGRQGTT